nr:MAG TPA: hypothetical protein [Caudoviricetes sp.]DAX05052.1 MAG TPA: hypothetical protein [Caudoviricetes sp.]
MLYTSHVNATTKLSVWRRVKVSACLACLKSLLNKPSVILN